MSRGYRDEDGPRRGQAEGVDIGEATALRMSDSGKALLIKLHDVLDKKTKTPREVWVPISQIHDDSEVYDDDANNLGVLVVTKWFAEQEDLT